MNFDVPVTHLIDKCMEVLSGKLFSMPFLLKLYHAVIEA
jgi:hypothetical protein